MNPDHYAVYNIVINFFIGLGTIAVAVIAVFQDKIRVWLSRPILDISVDVKPPDCHKTFIIKTPGRNVVEDYADCYYFRLRVKNIGNRRAEMVEVFVAELSKKMADGVFKKVDSFLPMGLRWSHIGSPFLKLISPGMEKHCDLGHIIDPKKNAQFDVEEDPRVDLGGKTFLSLDLEIQPFTMSHLIQPGIYRLKLLIASSDTKPVEKTLEINHTGIWIDDERKMLNEGIGMHIIN